MTQILETPYGWVCPHCNTRLTTSAYRGTVERCWVCGYPQVHNRYLNMNVRVRRVQERGKMALFAKYTNIIAARRGYILDAAPCLNPATQNNSAG